MKKMSLVLLLACFLLGGCHIPRPNLSPTPALNDLQTFAVETAQMFAIQTITYEELYISTPTDSSPPTSTFSPTPISTDTPEQGYGSISGNISGYPYGGIPRLSIVALSQTSPGTYWYWITGIGDTYFSMDGYVSTGKYQVVAYDSSGHAGGCSATIEVKNNEIVTCDISNWGGSYPSKPSGVP